MVHGHLIMGQFSELVSAFEDSGEWQGAGMRSCADWLVVHGGFDRHTACTPHKASATAPPPQRSSSTSPLRGRER